MTWQYPNAPYCKFVCISQVITNSLKKKKKILVINIVWKITQELLTLYSVPNCTSFRVVWDNLQYISTDEKCIKIQKSKCVNTYIFFQIFYFMFESNSTKCWTSLNWRNIEPWSNDPKSEYNIFKTFMKIFFFYKIKFKIHKEQIKIGSVVL